MKQEEYMLLDQLDWMALCKSTSCKSCLGGGGKCEYEDYRDEWRSVMVRGNVKEEIC